MSKKGKEYTFKLTCNEADKWYIGIQPTKDDGSTLDYDKRNGSQSGAGPKTTYIYITKTFTTAGTHVIAKAFYYEGESFSRLRMTTVDIEVNIIKVDIDDAGVRDTDDLQIQYFRNNKGTFTYTAIPYLIYYTIKPDTGWASDSVFLKIRDASGAVIRTKLLSVGTGIGQQDTTWDGKDDSGDYPEYGTNTYKAEIVVTVGSAEYADEKTFSIWEIRQGNNLYRDNGWPVPDIHGAILYEYNGLFNSLADLQDNSKYTVVHHRGASGTMATDSVAVFKTGGSGTYMGAHCPDELKNAGRRAKRKAILEKAAQMLAANPPYISPVTDVLHHKGLTWDGTIADIAETRSDGVNEVSYEGVSVRLYGSNWWSITTPSPSTNLDKHNEGSDSMLPSKQRSGPLTSNTPDELRKP